MVWRLILSLCSRIVYHSRARSHQDGADLRADRSTAYFVSCIWVRSAHGNSFDHLVGEGEQRRGQLEAE
jgi:hypothetical protein